MVQFTVSEPDISQFVNRRSIPCSVCGKIFTTYYQGVQVDIVDTRESYVAHWKLREKYLPYGKEAMCSEECATLYILSVIGPGGA